MNSAEQDRQIHPTKLGSLTTALVIMRCCLGWCQLGYHPAQNHDTYIYIYFFFVWTFNTHNMCWNRLPWNVVSDPITEYAVYAYFQEGQPQSNQTQLLSDRRRRHFASTRLPRPMGTSLKPRFTVASRNALRWKSQPSTAVDRSREIVSAICPCVLL